MLACCTALLALAAALPARVSAQQPDTARVRPDTAAVPDTTAVRPDTLPGDSVAAQDTLPPPPPPPMPPMPSAVPAGFATGVWVWDRAALLAEPYLSVNDLLDRLPGIVTLRHGLHLQSEAASVWGATAGSIQVEIDGYTLWPLEEPSFDLSRIELGTLESVRIERRAAGLRIVLHTAQPFAGEPYTRIEAGIGEPIDVNLFRGLFLAPDVAFGPLSVAVERFETEGIDGSEPADMFSGWVKWGVTRERFGAQVEYRQQSLDRDGASPFPGGYDRRDVLLRTRVVATDGLTFEAYGGVSDADIDLPDDDDDPVDRIERDVIQIGTRGSYRGGPITVEAGARYGNERRIPQLELEARSWLQLGFLGAGAEVHSSSWRDGDATTSWLVHGVITPVPLLSLFAQLGGGSVAAPAWRDYGRTILESEHDQLRAGAQLRWRGLDVGAAYLAIERDTAFGFHLPFDSAAPALPLGTLRGWELYGRVPLFRDIVSVDGALTNWVEWTNSAYTPTQTWRGAFNIHWVPLESGNLDILTRVEARYRGSMFLPTLSDELVREAVPARTVFDWWLRIQIMSVQAFLRYEDLSAERPADFPGRGLNGPRLVYGVKWFFFN